MPFNGAGQYSPPGSDFPAVPATLIESTHFNNVVNDLATALSLCVTKDGQQTLTANIPMGTFRLTGLGAGVAAGDSVRYEQVVGVYLPLANPVFTGVITGGDGAAATPAYSFTSDPDTGFYRVSANVLGLSLGGTQALNFTSGTINTGANVSTGDAAIELGGARTGSGQAFLDLHSAAGADFEARILRASGANGELDIVQTGTGATRLFYATSSVGFAMQASGAITTGNASVASGYSAAGDITLPVTGAVRAANTAKAKVRFDPTGAIVGTAFNVASITDSGVGFWIVNMTNALPDANFVVAGSVKSPSNGANRSMFAEGSAARATTTVQIVNALEGSGLADPTEVSVVIF